MTGMKTSRLKLVMSVMLISSLAFPAGAEGTNTVGASSSGISTASTPSQQREEPVRDPVEVAGDALGVGPGGLVATVVGAAIYVVALPFAAISGDVRGAGRSLVGAPAAFTFKRKLGDFEHTSSQ